MILFVKLFLAHLLGDFLLQPNSWVRNKEEKKLRSPYLYLHTLLHGVLAFAVAGKEGFWVYAMVLAVVHGGIDAAKLVLQRDATKRQWFIIDQLLHIASICLIVMWNEPTDLEWQLDDSFLILLTGAILLTKPTSLLIKVIISGWTPDDKPGDGSLSNAGNYIGILERLFVFGFILTGHFEAIGFLLGAKSIFRFGDLTRANDRKLTEYVLIGTLLSFGIAILAGLAAQYLAMEAAVGLLG
ncbi:MAG TPA: DUF3307 domain-containing protein [Flavobacterium sp.]|nr:DUF3307 domain-containing protein [Flavobacterium sp.]